LKTDVPAKGWVFEEENTALDGSTTSRFSKAMAGFQDQLSIILNAGASKPL
jgi:hypothetical protein